MEHALMSTSEYQVVKTNIYIKPLTGYQFSDLEVATPKKKQESIQRRLKRGNSQMSLGELEKRQSRRSSRTLLEVTSETEDKIMETPIPARPRRGTNGSLTHRASLPGTMDMRRGSKPPTVGTPLKGRRRRGRFKNEGEALMLFRRSGRKVKIVLTWISILEEIKDNELDRHLKSFTELAVEYQIEQTDTETSSNVNEELHFDKNYYKANRDINLNHEIKEILTLHPDGRTKDMCYKAVHGLQLLKSFADYPLHMQEKLSAVAWYTTVTPKRLIIRQGHHAENFYFILSGQALVKVAVRNDGDSSYNKTVAFLKRDDCFGEVGLLYRSQRTATVESATPMELLTVSREDFLKIFMNTNEPGDEPDHIKFLRELNFMMDWPVERLIGDTRQCMMSFFRRNTVIFTNSEDTEYIYIVKSGSVQLLKRLAVPPNGSPPLRRANNSSTNALQFAGLRQPSARVYTGRDSSPAEVRIDAELHAMMVSQSQEEVDRRRRKSSPTETENDRPPVRKTTTKRTPRASQVSYRPRAASAKSTNEDYDTLMPCFVEVAQLQARDVFGLHNLVFQNEMPREQPILSMVSKGAEVIMLTKRFFMHHMNERVKLYIREHVRPYPVHDALQKKLLDSLEWHRFKRSVLEDCITTRKEAADLTNKLNPL